MWQGPYVNWLGFLCKWEYNGNALAAGGAVASVGESYWSSPCCQSQTHPLVIRQQTRPRSPWANIKPVVFPGDAGKTKDKRSILRRAIDLSMMSVTDPSVGNQANNKPRDPALRSKNCFQSNWNVTPLTDYSMSLISINIDLILLSATQPAAATSDFT